MHGWNLHVSFFMYQVILIQNIQNIRCTHEVCEQTYSWGASPPLPYTSYTSSQYNISCSAWSFSKGQLVINVSRVSQNNVSFLGGGGFKTGKSNISFFIDIELCAQSLSSFYFSHLYYLRR